MKDHRPVELDGYLSGQLGVLLDNLNLNAAAGQPFGHQEAHPAAAEDGDVFYGALRRTEDLAQLVHIIAVGHQVEAIGGLDDDIGTRRYKAADADDGGHDTGPGEVNLGQLLIHQGRPFYFELSNLDEAAGEVLHRG